MRIREVEVLIEARDDLVEGRAFYDFQSPSVGDYFIESVLGDLGALRLYAGIHRRMSGFYRQLCSRFPFASITRLWRIVCKLRPYWICVRIPLGSERVSRSENLESVYKLAGEGWRPERLSF